MEKHSNDLGNATRTITELRTKVKIIKESGCNKCSQVTELENKLISNNKELHAAQDLNQALQHEYKETMAQKEDQVNQPHGTVPKPIMLTSFSGGEDSDPGEEVPELAKGGDAVARLERAGRAGDEEQG